MSKRSVGWKKAFLRHFTAVHLYTCCQTTCCRKICVKTIGTIIPRNSSSQHLLLNCEHTLQFCARFAHNPAPTLKAISLMTVSILRSEESSLLGNHLHRSDWSEFKKFKWRRQCVKEGTINVLYGIGRHAENISDTQKLMQRLYLNDILYLGQADHQVSYELVKHRSK